MSQSEERLLERFNEILRELEGIWQNNAYGVSDWDNLGQQREGWQKQEGIILEITKRVEELESLGIEKVKLEEYIHQILQKVEDDIRKILSSSQLTETEKRIKSILDQMRNYLKERKAPAYIFHGDTSSFALLKRLNVSEQDLINSRERLLRVMKKLVQAAESLE